LIEILSGQKSKKVIVTLAIGGDFESNWRNQSLPLLRDYCKTLNCPDIETQRYLDLRSPVFRVSLRRFTIDLLNDRFLQLSGKVDFLT